MTTDALLLSGTGRYSDPWHPFAETSEALAGLLADRGAHVRTAVNVDAALARLAPTRGAAGTLAGDAPDLLVVNVGLPRDGGTSPGTEAAHAGLRAWAGSGRPTLAVHSSSTSFVDAPCWEDVLGGRWVRGRTMHPDYGPARIRLESSALTAELEDFTLDDERYSWLRTTAGIEVHATHEHEGGRHPIVWSHVRGGARTFYDALGHDAASYASSPRRALLLRGLDWLLS
ncbi:ThuA domain-containing protein [Zhihengliuella halotolerans]|uniref:ThuA-like domain-containing protein n=1 Tax=Zhihengliuella halotolerans TaxID=370736 RepID=A0A4Q8AFA9_9MICC|nr:ThuA domain-containing protein [Zhihengliuella halotolerans]RZU62541.1 hypothetical protein EV380_2138 [Zhihengliuella halotolerans]